MASNRNNQKSIILRLVSMVGKLLSVLLIIIAVFLLLFPVLMLPVTTSTPDYMWPVLILADLAIIILSFRIKQSTKKYLVLFAGLFSVLIVGTAASQIFASTPSITDSSGKSIPGSIATLEQVTLNGSKQWITIRGQDSTKPVLLYLGIGGPGAGGFPATFTSLKPLENYFVVVNWDQPGTGKSYHSRPIQSLTTQVFVDDARALADMMRQRFHQDKIYVMGLSWGTILGTELVKQYPDLFYAYIGNGQMINTVENDRFGYDLALKITKEQGKTDIYNKLKNNGQPPYTGNGLGLKYADYNNVLFDHMDSPNIPMIMALVPQLAKEYGYIDKINFDLGLYKSFTVLYPQLKDLDFITQASKINVPMYFIVGKKDVNAVATIVERYYQKLQAPYKELIWLESGHGATADEIKSALVNHVLVKSPPKAK